MEDRRNAGRGTLAVLVSVAAAVALGVPLASGGTSFRSRTPVVGNVKLGKVLFVAACGGCHTLKAAGTKGRRGPNLDQEPSAYPALLTQIKYGGEGMPGFGTAFKKAQIQAIAAFVSKSTPYAAAGGG